MDSRKLGTLLEAREVSLVGKTGLWYRIEIGTADPPQTTRRRAGTS